MRPSSSLQGPLRRLKLTTKQAPKKGGYYKGTRTGSMGWHTRKGTYIIDLHKVRTYVPPKNENGLPMSSLDWDATPLKPFVSNDVAKPLPEKVVKKLEANLEFQKAEEAAEAYNIGAMTGRNFLEQWKEMQGKQLPEPGWKLELKERKLRREAEEEADHRWLEKKIKGR